jgi:hypothetical protein
MAIRRDRLVQGDAISGSTTRRRPSAVARLDEMLTAKPALTAASFNSMGSQLARR